MKKSNEFLDGWFAHKNGRPGECDDVPYNMETQACSFYKWIEGYDSRKRAVENGDSLDLDNC